MRGLRSMLSSIARAIRWAADRHARVINLSLAGLGPVRGLRGGGRLRTGPRRARRRGGRELLRRELQRAARRPARSRRLLGYRTCSPSARRPPKDRPRASRYRTRAGSISPRPASSSRRSGRRGTTHTPRRPTAPSSARRAATRPAGPRRQHGARAGPRSRRRWSRPRPRSSSAPTPASAPSRSRRCSGRRLGRSPIRDTRRGPESSTLRRPSIASARERFHRRTTPSQTTELPPRLEFRLEGVRATLDWHDDPVDVYRLTLRRGDTLVVHPDAPGATVSIVGRGCALSAPLGRGLRYLARRPGTYLLRLAATVGSRVGYRVKVQRIRSS